MQRMLILVGVLATPAFAATFTGTVTDDSGVAVYKARVLVLHDLSLALSQRKNTDFNGLYHFDLDPGPYRILVLKDGFQPVFEEILILHEAEQFKVDFQLKPREALANNREDPRGNREETRANRIKEVFRGSNLNPMRAESLYASARFSPSPADKQGFAGQVRSGTRRDLDGVLEQTRSLEVKTRIGDNMALRSAFTDTRDTVGEKTAEYAAVVDFNLPATTLMLAAETRRHGDLPDKVSDRAQLEASYGEDQMSTAVELQTSKASATDQRVLSLRQKASAEFGAQQLAGELTASDWRDQGQAYANRAQLTARWQNQEVPWFAIAATLDRLEAGDLQTNSETTWLIFHNGKPGAAHFSSELGYLDRPEGPSFVQRHRLSVPLGGLALEAHFTDERELVSVNDSDLYGSYLSSNASPYLHEGFVDDHRREVGLELALQPTPQLRTVLSLQQTNDVGEVRFSRLEGFFRNDAERDEKRLGLGLELRNYDASFHYSYAQNHNDVADFTQQALSYRQSFNPFRNKALGIQVELTLQDTPDVPSWYLLERLPWLEHRENWYEGHLALQF